MTEISEMIKTTERSTSAHPARLWATHAHDDDRATPSPALPEDVIARIADLIAYGITRPEDAGNLRRAAEEVRVMRGRLEGLEAEKVVVEDRREAERLIEAYANEFGG